MTETKSVTLTASDLYDSLPDTTRQRSDFTAPCDLIFREADGGERTLYDCTSGFDGGDSCAALDPAVSFDAKRIAFSVFRGPVEHYFAAVSATDIDPAAENVTTNFPSLPGWYLASREAQLYVVDVATGALTALPHEPGVFDFGPVWLAGGRLGFTTDRTQTYGPRPACTYSNPRAIQYASMNLNGTDVVRPNAHALASELHPIPLVDGRVLISSWQLFGMLSYGHPNAAGSCGTLNNKFHLFALDPDGSRQTAVYGQHLDDPTYTEYDAPMHLATHMSAHFMTQSSDERIWVGEYYRANNLGLGVINGFDLPPQGQEGLTTAQAVLLKVSAYRVPNQVSLAGFAGNADQSSGPMPAPAMSVPTYADPLYFAGKVGHPSAAPGNRLLLTWGKGMCTQAVGTSFITTMQNLKATAHDNPACDTGIYLTPSLPSSKANSEPILSHPSQLQLVVDRREYHEFFARAVVPYRALYGIDAPPAVAPGASTGRSEGDLPSATPFGMLGAASLLHRETKPVEGAFLFEGPNQMAHAGTDVIDYSDDELCGVRILAVLPNRKQEYKQISFSPVGERVGIIGEFAVRKATGTLAGC